jgi:hypothetical protein
MVNSLTKKLIKWDQEARKNWTYEFDNKQFGKTDDWRSHANAVLAGKHWRDDCDGLASTIIDLLVRDGYPPNKLWRCVVSSKKTDKIDHFIGLAHDGEQMYVIGDTFGPIYPVKKIPHRIIAVSNLTDGIKWKRVQHGVFVLAK